MNDPFFIVGASRSGTTLLRMMLTSHSRLSIPPETWYLIPLRDELPHDRPLQAQEIDRAVAIMTGHRFWAGLKLDVIEFRRRVAALQAPFLRDVVEVVYGWYLEKEGKARWGDKTPIYVSVVPELAQMFPDARFIHLIRDGRDVGKSSQGHRWRGPFLHANLDEWIKTVDYDASWTAPELRARILRVHYEQLVLEPEVTLRELCRFLGEEFEPQMLSWQDKVDERIPAREVPIHSKLKRKTESGDVCRWKREMTRWEIFSAEAFMGKHLTRVGYERAYSSPLWAPAFAATRLYCRTLLPAGHFCKRAFRFVKRRVRPRERCA